jgi:gliding motility-associated-like protein
MKQRIIVFILLFLSIKASTQGCFPDTPDTTITLNCSDNCTNLLFKIPDLRNTSEYLVRQIPYAPLPFTDRFANAVEFNSTTFWKGNSYSDVFDLPFDFCFFDSVYNKLVVGANGTVSFDASMANGWCEPLMIRGQVRLPLPNIRYAKAMIAAVMHDLDPGDTARVSPNRKIEFRIEGTAPCRKIVISYFEVPLWPVSIQAACQTRINTHQMVLYEGTGIIDVFIKDAPTCTPSNGGLNMLAIQNWDRDEAYSPRDMNAAPWGTTGMNAAYRFLPSGGTSLLQSTELFVNGRPVANGTVFPGNNGELEVEFANICPSAPLTSYVIKAVYASCSGTGTIELYDTIHVAKTNSLTATATADPAFCTSNTGSVTVTVPAGQGVPPLQYSLNGGAPQTSNVFSNLAAGNYTITITDASVCTDVIQVRVPSINALTVSFDVIPTSCNSATDGRITVNADRALPPVRYSINGGPPQTSNVFTNLAAGSYTIRVTDAAGCVRTSTAVVPAGSGLFSTYTKSDITCAGNGDGSITIDPPLTGAPPFRYSIDGVNYSTNNTFNNLAAGNYIIRIRDNNGCTGQVFVFILEPRPLLAAFTQQGVRCNGGNDGVITVNPSGGTAPYQYSLDGTNYQTANSFSVAANTYTVYVRDNNGCTTSGQVTITQPSVITASSTATNATCDGGADGRITVSVNGGTAPYQYSIEGIIYQSSNVFDVGPGSFIIRIRDTNGCSTITNVTVGLNNNLTLTPLTNATICEGDSVQLNAQSNATTYSWSPAASLSNASVDDPFAFPRRTTDYYLTATLGRCSANDTVTVLVKPAPIPDAGANGDICFGQTYTLRGSGGINYSWSPSTYLNSSTIQNPVVTPDSTIQYSLHVVDANGCKSLQADQVTVNVKPPIKIILPKEIIASQGDQVMLQASSVATNYLWSPTLGLNNPFIANPVVTVDRDIIYKVTATTSAGCKGEASISIKVYKGPDLYVPTAFTPNNDGRNDLFYPFPVGIKTLTYFRVYNRWGEVIFSTNQLMKGWDGKAGNLEQPSGVYVWMVEGISKEGKKITKKGTVNLIR